MTETGTPIATPTHAGSRLPGRARSRWSAGLAVAAAICLAAPQSLAAQAGAVETAEHQAAAPPDAWSIWSDGFDQAMTACVVAGGTSCLSRAFTAHPRPVLQGDPPDVVEVLYRDLRTAQTMLRQKQARDLLWRGYGIDGSDYIGTGYSVPLAGLGAGDYGYARQREYFVPNLCAEAVDPAVCPQQAANVWTVRLTAEELALWLDRPIAKLFAARHLKKTLARFAKQASQDGAAPARLPRFLVRFGNLPLAYYKGTFGRPDAVRVFFTDLDQVRTGTLRQAMIATGASGLIEKPDPAKTFFIWIYAPGADSQASVASWGALFDILAKPPA